jgi:hypothetical protein
MFQSGNYMIQLDSIFIQIVMSHKSMKCVDLVCFLTFKSKIQQHTEVIFRDQNKLRNSGAHCILLDSGPVNSKIYFQTRSSGIP